MTAMEQKQIDKIREWAQEYVDDFDFGYGDGERTFEEIVDIDGMDVYFEFFAREFSDWENHKEFTDNYICVNACSVSHDDGEWSEDVDLSDIERYERVWSEPSDLDMFGRCG